MHKGLKGEYDKDPSELNISMSNLHRSTYTGVAVSNTPVSDFSSHCTPRKYYLPP